MKKIKRELDVIGDNLAKINKILPGLNAPYYSDDEKEDIVNDVLKKAEEVKVKVDKLHDYVDKKRKQSNGFQENKLNFI